MRSNYCTYLVSYNCYHLLNAPTKFVTNIQIEEDALHNRMVMRKDENVSRACNGEMKRETAVGKLRPQDTIMPLTAARNSSVHNPFDSPYAAR